MKFSVEKDTFKKALDIANLGIGTDSGTYRERFKFEVSEDQTVIRSTDDNSFVFVPLETLEVESSGSFLISADRLQTWVKNLPEGDITMEKEGSNIVASQGDIVGKFIRYRPEDFAPVANQLESSFDVQTLSVKRFQKAFGFVEPFLEEVDDGTSSRAWIQVAELWDGEVVASNIKSVNCYRDPALQVNPLECKDGDADKIKALARDHDSISADDVLTKKDGQTVARRNTLHRLMNESDLSRDESWWVVNQFQQRRLDPFRISKNVLSSLLSFTRKIEDEQVTICQADTTYGVETESGAVFGFNRSQHEMPYLLGVMFPDPVENHRWKLDTGQLLKGIKALSATAPTNEEHLTMEFRSEPDGDFVDLHMDAEAGDGESVYPLEVEFLEGCEGESCKIGIERLKQVIGQYENKPAEFGLSKEEDYVKISGIPEDDDEGIFKYSQISLVL